MAIENWRGTDVLGSTVDSTRKSASLPREMEVEVEIEQMLKRLARDRPHRVLADVRKHRVQQLAEQRRTYARRTVYHSQTNSAFFFFARRAKFD